MAAREHSRAELEQKLARYGPTPEELTETLDFLVSQGWLSDARYASEVVRSKSSRVSRARLAERLRSKGVATEHITSATESLDDLATAESVWAKKFGGALPTNAKETARQVRFLQSRGFSVEVALKVIRRKRE